MPAPARFGIGEMVWAWYAQDFGQVLKVEWREDYQWRYQVLEFDGATYPYWENELHRTVVTFAGPVKVE
jgi:hypothetical protein